MEGRGTILIIDDDDIIIQFLKLQLEADHDVVSASNGAQGLALAREVQPDLVLLDVRLPDITGHGLCRSLKTDVLTQSIPVIFITAMGSTEDEIAGLEAGAVDYISKPIVPTVLKARVGNHMKLKRQCDYLETLSLFDGLTGVKNRRGFDLQLDAEWRRAARASSCLSLLLLDIDRFKLFNDRYGHPAGDDCLRQVAACLGGIPRRPGDLVARYGGEEFVVLLPETPFDAARVLADRCREDVANLGIPHANAGPLDVLTMSVGAASVVPRPTDRARDLIQAADEMLYASKREGGNAVNSVNLSEDRNAVPVLVERA